ncbi:hypothetical protein CDD83_11241 [Cordyceps sp. RAO-2017]|nr:hypothetical protein CDD83_11241 [Cordyceps sp. RAO-2017]
MPSEIITLEVCHAAGAARDCGAARTEVGVGPERAVVAALSTRNVREKDRARTDEQGTIRYSENQARQVSIPARTEMPVRRGRVYTQNKRVAFSKRRRSGRAEALPKHTAQVASCLQARCSIASSPREWGPRQRRASQSGRTPRQPHYASDAIHLRKSPLKSSSSATEIAAAGQARALRQRAEPQNPAVPSRRPARVTSSSNLNSPSSDFFFFFASSSAPLPFATALPSIALLRHVLRRHLPRPAGHPLPAAAR